MQHLRPEQHDEQVGFLLAVPSFIGLTLFWTGGASGVRLSLRGAIVSVVIGIAHLVLAGMHSFGAVTVATTIFAIAVANAGGLVPRPPRELDPHARAR
eukprot:3308415-Rhodomonas_salina.4